MELLQMLSASEIVAQIFCFFLVLFILRKFAWKKILKLLDERKEKIASQLKKIEDAQAEVAKIKAAYEDKLASIDSAARARIQEAISEGRKITDEVRKKAHHEADEIISNAKSNIRHELSVAKEALKYEIFELTIKATENVIQEKLTEDDDRRLIRDFLDKIGEAE